MTQKTLKIKRVFVNAIHNSLRNVPPKDFPTTGEIKTTISTILPSLKVHLDEYVKFAAEVDDLRTKIVNKELTEEESNKMIEDLNARLRTYNKEHGNEIVDVVMEEEGMKVLRTQFERDNWGKTWLMNIEEFAELMDGFTEALK